MNAGDVKMVRALSFLVSAVSRQWKAATAYNPERHYMRGPGPKWRQKHAVRGEPPMRIDGMDRVVSSH
jgi:hypothetical protein